MKQINSITSPLILAALMCLATVKSIGQNIKPAAMLTMKGHIVKSSVNKKSYQLYVSLPKNYSATDTIHYPVLYVLDGKFSFPSFSSIREVLDLAREIKDVIIVAIGDSSQSESDWQVSRYTDYTPSHVGQMDTVWSYILKIAVGTLKSGGSPSFLATIRKDIIPFIDTHYKATNDRGISGHSLGGLFAGYCLLTAPDLFTRYGINSPALWWNDKEMLSLENSFAKKHKALDAKIFISVGALEGEAMVSPITAFANSLKTHSYKGLTLTSQIFDDETHVSVASASNSRTLRVLYGAPMK
jgi:hypothetical protein